MCSQTIKRISFALLSVFILVLASTVASAQAQEEQIVPISHFITPQEGSIVSGFVSVEVFMLNGHGQAVELGVDGRNWQPMAYAGRGRYETIWNANFVPVGNHTLRARFVSGSEKAAPAQPTVNVIVINSMPTDPPEKSSQAEAASILLSQSDDDPSSDEASPNLMILAYGETGIISSHTTAIQFARVLEDSRCPTGTICVWAGAVEVELLVWTGINPEPEAVLLHLDPTKPDAATVVLSNNVTLRLSWVNPYPAGDPIPQKAYVIGLEFQLS